MLRLKWIQLGFKKIGHFDLQQRNTRNQPFCDVQCVKSMFQQEEVVSVQWLIEWSKKKKIFFYKIFTQTAKHWTFGPCYAKWARTTWHMISSNLHLKSSAENSGSNWVLIQGAIFTVSILLLFLDFHHFHLVIWRMKWAKKIKTKHGPNMSSGPFLPDAAHISWYMVHSFSCL